MADGPTTEQLSEQLSGLDDAELLEVLNAALAARQGTPMTEQGQDDERFYKSVYPDGGRRGPRVARTPDED